MIEGFAALFLSIAIATRWWIAREVSGLALAAWIVTVLSLWLALRPFPT